MNEHRAEAAFQDPSLGWVSVRAQADPQGGVHATIVTGSSSAAQVLDAHLASLNEHIATLHPHLHSLTLAAADTSWNGQGFDHNAQQQKGSSEQHGHDSQQPAQQIDDPPHSLPAVASADTALSGIPSVLADYGSNGGHVSLIA